MTIVEKGDTKNKSNLFAGVEVHQANTSYKQHSWKNPGRNTKDKDQITFASK